MSLKDLRTFENTVYATYKEACLARGLIKDDLEYRKTMEEAAGYKMPAQLRFIFAMLLIYCGPTFPNKLWEEFASDLSHDYVRKYGEVNGKKVAYRKIEDILRRNESKFADFEMEEAANIVESTLPGYVPMPNEVFEMTPEQHTVKGLENRAKLNADQENVVTDILQMLESNNLEAKCRFLDGPGGTGKTFVYNTVFHILKGLGKNVMTMAYTGIAAILLPTGRTIHSCFKLGINIDENSSSGVEKSTNEANVLIGTDVFIIDEASFARHGPNAARSNRQCVCAFWRQDNVVWWRFSSNIADC